MSATDLGEDLQAALDSMRAAWGAEVQLHPARGLVFVAVPGEPSRMYQESEVLSHWRKLHMMALGLSLDPTGLQVFWDALPQYRRHVQH